MKRIEKINDGIVKGLDRVLEKPKRRFVSSMGASVLLNLASSASATGVLLGKGETLAQKAKDAFFALPNMFSGIKYYFQLPEYVRKANATTEYLRDHGEFVADTLAQTGRKIESGLELAEKGFDQINQGKDYLVPGGEYRFNLKGAFDSFGEAYRNLRDASDSIQQSGSQLKETAAPVVDALKQVDLHPIMRSLHNLADNIAPDEIAQTAAVVLACVGLGYASSQYIRGYWGKRGRPGPIARTIQRHGIRKFKDYYTRNPEKIAGEEGIEAYEQHLIQNRKKLEDLARKAGILGEEK